MLDKIEELFENWIEWKMYKILYLGILVPLLIDEVKKWIFQNFSISLIYLLTAGILILPTFFKALNIIKFIGEKINGQRI